MSKKIYKGYQLMKAIADGEIKEGSRFKIHSWSEAIEYHNNNLIFIEDWVTNEEGDNYGNTIFELWNLDYILDLTFELIEDETIDIESINELETYSEDGVEFYDKSDIHKIAKKTNEILQWAKQQERRMKKLENKEYCQVCGVELTEENRYMKNMCNECKYGEEDKQ